MATLSAALLASAHVVMTKRDERGALGWVGVIWLAPGLGPLLYLVFGINRIRRRAARLRASHRTALPAEAVDRPSVEPLPEFDSLARALDTVCRFTRVEHNRFLPLIDGEEAYPAMLEAIEEARRSLALMTYIFDRDETGKEFVEALARAHQRGLEVRVLVDDAGLRYSRPSVLSDLRRRGVPHARFMPAVFSRAPYVNLRTHRKALVVDGRMAFTGGMNIRQGHRLKARPRDPVRDIHFRVDGPVVRQIFQVFAEDWWFTTKEELTGPAWADAARPSGASVARTIADGPDEDHDRLRWAILAGLAAAKRSVRILTPYFLPDDSIRTALEVASHRGVEVDVVLPERSNLRFVQWAMWGQLLPVLESPCRVWLSPPPFDHSKLMIVDDGWTLIGSGNWDPRSLRLNFELNVEVYDRGLAGSLAAEFDARRAASRRMTAAEWRERSFSVRFRDGIARLFAPYL